MPVAEMLLELRSSQVVETIGQVRELAGAGMIQTAMEEAFFALQLAPTYLPVHIEIGELLLPKKGRTDEAVRKFMAVADLYNARGEIGAGGAHAAAYPADRADGPDGARAPDQPAR